MMDGRDLYIPNERPGKSGFGLGLKNTYKGLKQVLEGPHDHLLREIEEYL